MLGNVALHEKNKITRAVCLNSNPFLVQIGLDVCPGLLSYLELNLGFTLYCLELDMDKETVSQ
jgi:hypothetical protein